MNNFVLYKTTMLKEAYLNHLTRSYGTVGRGMSFADLHVHTKSDKMNGDHHIGSRDAHMTPEETVDFAEIMGLNVIAITDHDEIRCAEMASNHASRQGYEVEVVVGSEITSKDGHIIGLGLQDTIKPGQSAEDTVKAIVRQGGLVIIPHPLSRKAALDEKTLLFLLNNVNPEIKVHGVEIFNAGSHIKDPEISNKTRDMFLNELKGRVAPIGSSDSHYFSVGKGLTAYKGNIFQAIGERETVVTYPDRLGQYALIEQSLAMFGFDILSVGNLRKHLERAVNGDRHIPPQFPNLRLARITELTG